VVLHYRHCIKYLRRALLREDGLLPLAEEADDVVEPRGEDRSPSLSPRQVGLPCILTRVVGLRLLAEGGSPGTGTTSVHGPVDLRYITEDPRPWANHQMRYSHTPVDENKGSSCTNRPTRSLTFPPPRGTNSSKAVRFISRVFIDSGPSAEG